MKLKSFLIPALLVLAALVTAPAAAQDKPAVPAKPAAPITLDVRPTVFFAETEGVLKRRIDLDVESTLPPTEAQVLVRGFRLPITVAVPALPTGKSVLEIYVPDSDRPVEATFSIQAGEARAARAVRLLPQRKWTLYLLPHSHTDIGYTDLQSRVAKNHVDYLDSVLEFCKATDDYPDEAKFRWNIEVAWALQNYIKSRPAGKVAELIARLKSGRVELSAWYLQLSDCFAHEELIRSVRLSRALSREYGFPLQSAMNNDVTGFSWAAPQILSQVGVRWFTTGINETRSRAPLRRPNPFYWESPDGSRILHWNGEHYLFSNYDLLLHEGLDRSRPKVEAYLNALQARGDYPYDAIAFHISGYVTDNCPPKKELSDRVRDWNARWAYPKLRLATMSEFFSAFEKKYAKTVPVHKLGWPDYWTDGVASTAFETGINRQAHGEIVAAELWNLAASRLDKSYAYPAAEIDSAYEQAMLYDEHTWGGWNSIGDPESEFARSQWATKSGFAYAAREIARTIGGRGLAALGRLIPTKDAYSLAVFNPLSWVRTDMVRASLPQALADANGKFKLIDRRNGAEISWQLLDKRTLLFQADAVPSMGYAVYSIVPGEAPAPPAPIAAVEENHIENRFFKVVVDPETGRIASLVDKETGAELADPAAPYAVNQYIYENPEGGREAVDNMTKLASYKRYSAEKADIKPGRQGPGASSLVVTAKTYRHPLVKQEIILYDGIKRVDIVNTLNKEETYEPEAGYFAFPFQVEGGKIRFEIADAVMAPESEQLPRTTRDWHTVQNWVEIAGPKTSVVWSPIEAPLVQFGGINTGRWLTKLEIKNGTIVSYALNNYWMTNFKAAQGGTLVFRYALTSRAGGADAVKSTRFGWEVHSPLAAVWLPDRNEGPLSGEEAGFFKVSSPNVLIQAVKPAENGEGIAVRLREIAGASAEVHLTSALVSGEEISFMMTDIAEIPANSFKVVPGSIYVLVKPLGLHTLVIKP